MLVRVPRTPRSGTVRHLDHIWSCLYKHGDSALRPALYAPLSGSRSLWLEPAAYLGLWVLVFCPSLLRREGERRRQGSSCGRGEREEQKDTHNDSDERTRAALPGFTLYL
jgi:hypothetical protein